MHVLNNCISSFVQYGLTDHIVGFGKKHRSRDFKSVNVCVFN